MFAILGMVTASNCRLYRKARPGARRSHRRIAHARIDIMALSFAAQQHFGNPLRFQLRPDVGQGRRQGPLITQCRLRSGKVCVALRCDSSDTSPIVTGDAVESDQRLVDLLPVIESKLFDARHGRGDPLPLLCIQIEVRPTPPDSLRQPLPGLSMGNAGPGSAATLRSS